MARTHDTRRTDLEVKTEYDMADGGMPDKQSYRSWRKKYRKMRHQFDCKMLENDRLFRQEQKALNTARRLAIEKDRLLDLLLDVNNSAQIPPDRRFDLALDPVKGEALALDIDRPSAGTVGARPAKAYRHLLQDVAHSTYAQCTALFPESIKDLQAGRDSPADPLQGLPHPPSFLTADDVDNYLYSVDTRIAKHEYDATSTMPAPAPLPTLAPHAHGAPEPANVSSRDFQLRNPTSVYNWLRKHAPKTFLQDAETHPTSAADKEHGDDTHMHTHTPSSRRAKGATTAGAKAVPARTKRASLRAPVEPMNSIDDDGTCDVATAASGAKGKRKRTVDDDPGYRPKGGASRPSKKKRKSESGETPTVALKKSRKSGEATAKTAEE